MADEKEVAIANTHVPDKLYGYGLQVRQMLYELLNEKSNPPAMLERIE